MSESLFPGRFIFMAKKAMYFKELHFLRINVARNISSARFIRSFALNFLRVKDRLLGIFRHKCRLILRISITIMLKFFPKREF